MRALALIDGEHYADVVRAAFDELPFEIVAAVLVGGAEKLRGGESYGVPVARDLEAAVGEHVPELVVDLSDEPALGPRARLQLVSRVLALRLPYVGADFRFDPPAFAPFDAPAIAVVGTGKRVGKTAVAGKLARLAAEGRDVVVVAMGRGGPSKPELIEEPPTVSELVARSRAGAHAASDYLETAVLARVPTIGCRRCGGGLAGAVGVSNVLDGAALAVAREPDLVVFDGSGASLPPVAVDARILVTTSAEAVGEGLNPYRVLVSDVVVALGDDGTTAEQVRAIKDVPVVAAELRLEPAEPLAGRRTAVFTTGPAPVDHLDAEVVRISRHLADRDALRRDLAGLDADVYLVELKAAAIDVVAEHAEANGAQIVFAANDVVSADGGGALERELRALVDTVAGERLPT